QAHVPVPTGHREDRGGARAGTCGPRHRRLRLLGQPVPAFLTETTQVGTGADLSNDSGVLAISHRPNVIIIFTDEQQARSLPIAQSRHGNETVQTPDLTRFAQDCAQFAQVFTPCPWCVPSRVAMMTGRYPRVNGSRTNEHLMRPSERHMPGVFADAGYSVGLVGKNHCFRDEQLAEFDHVWLANHLGPVDASYDPRVQAAKDWVRESGPGPKCWGAATNPHPHEALGTAQTVSHGIDFLDEVGDDPFFLWLSIPDPHTPLQAAEPWASMYDPDEVPLPPLIDGEMESKPTCQQIDYRALCGNTVTEPIMRRAIAMYYGMVSAIDHEVGRFLGELEDRGLAEETIVVYTSDHGDYVGEHRMIRKSKALYDCLTQIPLMVRWPGELDGGARHDELLSNVDLMPTLLDLCGLETPAGVQGRSFAPLLRGGPYEPRDALLMEAGSTQPRVALEDAGPFPEGPLTPDFSPRMKLGGRGLIRGVRTKTHKLVRYPGGDEGELYDLTADPWELENLWGRAEQEGIEGDLTARLLDLHIETKDPLPVDAKGTPD
ncbi:MAG: sulfatase-like hydrolase/transferase, partial [Armatimonadia bacterium]|nr:sulfatase-like hydrolase/transferase [Armatimonadia bacterium]